MLEAKKSRWFEKVFSIYTSNLLKRRFHSFRVSGLDVLRAKNSQMPMIIYVNHSSWWDGLVAFQISAKLKLDSFVMMEEKQLKNLFLFRKLGAFSVIRENPREALESVNYAANLLKVNSRRTLWIFPQGEILPNNARPLRFYGGLSKIVERVGQCQVVPMAICYEFLKDFKPEIFVKSGKAEVFGNFKTNDSKRMTQNFETAMTSLLEELNTNILNNNFKKFEQII